MLGGRAGDPGDRQEHLLVDHERGARAGADDRAGRDPVGGGRVAVREPDGALRLLPDDLLPGRRELARTPSRGSGAVVAGITPASGSTAVAAGSAVTVNEIGPMVSIWGVTEMSAAGRIVTANTAPAPRRRSRTSRRREQAPAADRGVRRRRGIARRRPAAAGRVLDARGAVVGRGGLGDRDARRWMGTASRDGSIGRPSPWPGCAAGATGRRPPQRRRRPRSPAAPARPVADASSPSSRIVVRVERRLVLADGREHRQPGRRRERPRRRVGRHDVQPPARGERLAGEQPEVDPRRRDPRPEREHEPDARVVRGPDPGRGGRDLVVGVEVDDRGRPRILDLHRAEHPAEGRVERVLRGVELDRLVREAERRHVLLVHEQLRRVARSPRSGRAP